MVNLKIIKNIYHKIKVNILYWIVAFISFITGHFKDFVLISIIITVHELGHILVAIYYKWHIDKVILLPFGAVTIFKEHLNRPIKEEFLILISGPLFQIVFYFILKNIIFDQNLFTNYHYFLLLFNLIPIIPLDGSKLVNVFLNKVLPFKISHLITIYISIISFFVFLRFNNLIYLLVFSFLLVKVIDEYLKHRFIFNKFLFERYLYDINFKKVKYISNISNMYRDYKHYIKDKNRYVTEKTLLKKRFDNRFKV